jgi:hypothetical protein
MDLRPNTIYKQQAQNKVIVKYVQTVKTTKNTPFFFLASGRKMGVRTDLLSWQKINSQAIGRKWSVWTPLSSYFFFALRK